MKKTWLTAMVAFGMMAGSAAAQYPDKDIQGIIQWGAGGSTDVVMRSITPHAEKLLGHKVVMQNVTGGVGAIALNKVAGMDADGYTLLMGAENPLLYKVMGIGKKDYSDFTPINVIARGTPILVARNDAPFNTYDEMIAYIAKHPKEVKFGSTGPGGLPSVITAMIKAVNPIDVTAVPYDGDGPALTALQGGALDVMPAVLGAAIETIKAGRMKPIALFDDKPNAALPKIEPITVKHAGFKKYLPWGPFFGIFVKKGTPDAAVKKLVAAYGEAARNADFDKMITGRSFIVLNLSGKPADDFLAKWQSTTSWLLQDAGVARHSPAEFNIPKP